MDGIKTEIKMGRAAILKSIQQNKPEFIQLPEINLEAFNDNFNLMEEFKKNLQLVGGKLLELDQLENLDTEIIKQYPTAKSIVSVYKDSRLGNLSTSKTTKPQDLQNVDLTILKGDFGVAENGAIWITENNFPFRALPFITNDLVLILEKKNLCLHLHDAYELIASRERTFGLFLSGPSKTADIEQCLVIGAQGAMSLTVFMI